jgi:pSer/pThr/pTyr-binding forkhead associated (FHA) protein
VDDLDSDLDETITVPRRSMVRPIISPIEDLEDTNVPDHGVSVSSPPPLVEPVRRPRLEEPSGIELTAQAEPPMEDVSTRPFTPSEFDSATEATQQFYRFRIGRTVVWLDAVSYVGRRPSSPRIIYGQMPRLVRVPSPRQEVSSTHIEVRQLGASVVLTDMRSTNGSIVFPPRGEPRKLRQGESVVATPGTLVDIGDGNVIEILPLETRPKPDASSPES